MSDQQWSLAPLHGVLACARPGYLLAGPLGRPGTHSLTLTLASTLTLTSTLNPTCRLSQLTKYDYYTYRLPQLARQELDDDETGEAAAGVRRPHAGNPTPSP